MTNEAFDLTPDQTPEPNSVNPNPAPAGAKQAGNAPYGLTQEEIRDVNKIKVSISSPAPIVILFGARTSGKTMTLVRLTRYLRDHGYKVEPDRIFRSSDSRYYQSMCDNFDAAIYEDDVNAAGTATIGFMLIRVMNEAGEPICQILEAPGEHYFDEKEPRASFPTYINEICAKENPKTWVFIVERNWKDAVARNNYAMKIIDMQTHIGKKDKIIFTCHKVDMHPELILSESNPNEKQFFEEIKNQYPGIFKRYENTNLSRLWRRYNFDFVAFSAGVFNKTQDGRQTYIPSKPVYPQKLWNAILKTVKGGWF